MQRNNYIYQKLITLHFWIREWEQSSQSVFNYSFTHPHLYQDIITATELALVLQRRVRARSSQKANRKMCISIGALTKPPTLSVVIFLWLDGQ